MAEPEDPKEPFGGISIEIEEPEDSVRVDPVTGTIEQDQDDGGVVVQLDARRPKADDDPNAFYGNLVDKLSAGELSALGNELHEAITADAESRGNRLAIESRAMDFLGLEIKEPRANAADSSAAVEGLSTVTNPLLLEACLKGWANSRAELLPSGGPLKIDDETAPASAAEDDLADDFEDIMNKWYTKVAKEYYPQTSHMLLWGTYFRGAGFKRVYRCPLKRRPTSQYVRSEQLIVSDSMHDFASCDRITLETEMRPSVMKRMQKIGAYRKADLPEPLPQPNEVQAKTAEIQGTQPVPQRPRDQPYVLWECQCEWDLPQFAPKGSDDDGIPLPYIITLDKESREVLAIHRDWDEEDEDCERQQMYVKYPYVPGPGFYGTGLLNILGNGSQAMTAAWRLCLDNGMFANFPAFVIAKLAGRQNTSDFRVSPGTGVGIETNGMPIDHVMTPMPFKDIQAGLLSFMEQVSTQLRALGGAAEIPASEGVANVPVGTMLAQIEQATKIMSAAHKDMHEAQAEEFELIRNLFRKYPEDFFRKNKFVDKNVWTVEKFLQAINDVHLVPRSDPNTPSHIHRIAKALALAQMLMNPALAQVMSAKEVALRICRVIHEDPTNLVIDPAPQQQGPNPQMITAAANLQKAQTGQFKAQVDAQVAQQEAQVKQQELASEKDIATVDLAKEMVIHGHDQDVARQNADMAQQQHGLAVAQHGLDVSQAVHDQGMDLAEHALNVHKAMKPEPKSDSTSK